MQTKLEELIDLDDKIRETLTTEELVRVAGGFGATDDSVAQILRDAMIQDKLDAREDHHELQRTFRTHRKINMCCQAPSKDNEKSILHSTLKWVSLFFKIPFI